MVFSHFVAKSKTHLGHHESRLPTSPSVTSRMNGLTGFRRDKSPLYFAHAFFDPPAPPFTPDGG
jgi:hypothetical protein